MDATHQKETYKFMDVPPFFASFFSFDSDNTYLGPTPVPPLMGDPIDFTSFDCYRITDA